MLRLKSVAADLTTARATTGSTRCLAEIDLRVAVELAKAGIA